ncbi:hypothetical protein [Demequina iriomotensis]|uniref:hypothetical protein n=1 Tax=Demequina iriomotensis TaxID=1536641 RepID=UPI0007841884|nr:hypothetical protein [Demequina iriomotensis]
MSILCSARGVRDAMLLVTAIGGIVVVSGACAAAGTVPHPPCEPAAICVGLWDPSTGYVVPVPPDAAGVVASERGALGVSYELPDGWSTTRLPEGDVILRLPEWIAPGAPVRPTITVFAEPLIPTLPCGDTADPEVGKDLASIRGALVAQDGVGVVSDERVELGGLSGYRLDLALAEGWTDTCPASAGVPGVAYLIDDHGTHLHRTITARSPVRLYLLDGPAGVIAVEAAVPVERVAYDDYMALVAPVVESLAFDVEE